MPEYYSIYSFHLYATLPRERDDPSTFGVEAVHVPFLGGIPEGCHNSCPKLKGKPVPGEEYRGYILYWAAAEIGLAIILQCVIYWLYHFLYSTPF